MKRAKDRAKKKKWGEKWANKKKTKIWWKKEITAKIDNVNCNRKHMAKLLCMHRLEIQWKSDIFFEFESEFVKSTYYKLNYICHRKRANRWKNGRRLGGENKSMHEFTAPQWMVSREGESGFIFGPLLSVFCHFQINLSFSILSSFNQPNTHTHKRFLFYSKLTTDNFALK